MTELLKLRGLHAGYGAAEVLHGVAMAIPAGRHHGLLGPNGAGKSTLLKCLSGVVRPHAGEIWLDGVSVTNQDNAGAVRSGIVHVPEGRQVFPELSVAENLWLGGYASPSTREARKAEVLDIFPRLGERLHQAANTLSGGEQQMLAIGRGLMSSPRLLMLDEPTLGLAPIIVDQLIVALDRIAERFKLTLLVVEQSLNLAPRLCAEISIMVDGRIAATGAPQDFTGDELMRIYAGQTATRVHA